jgi:hypothetical protein
MRCRLLLGVVVASALAGCREDICARNSDCDPGYVCSDEGECVVPDHTAADAATGDGAIDAPPDAPPDAAVDAASDGGGI